MYSVKRGKGKIKKIRIEEASGKGRDWNVDRRQVCPAKVNKSNVVNK